MYTILHKDKCFMKTTLCICATELYTHIIYYIYYYVCIHVIYMYTCVYMLFYLNINGS